MIMGDTSYRLNFDQGKKNETQHHSQGRRYGGTPPPNNSKVGQNAKYLVKVGQSCRADLATACQRLRTNLVKFG
jgi:hypothetical protein